MAATMAAVATATAVAMAMASAEMVVALAMAMAVAVAMKVAAAVAAAVTLPVLQTPHFRFLRLVDIPCESPISPLVPTPRSSPLLVSVWRRRAPRSLELPRRVLPFLVLLRRSLLDSALRDCALRRVPLRPLAWLGRLLPGGTCHSCPSGSEKCPDALALCVLA